jgi:hypothetical protein
MKKGERGKAEREREERACRKKTTEDQKIKKGENTERRE